MSSSNPHYNKLLAKKGLGKCDDNEVQNKDQHFETLIANIKSVQAHIQISCPIKQKSNKTCMYMRKVVDTYPSDFATFLVIFIFFFVPLYSSSRVHSNVFSTGGGFSRWLVLVTGSFCELEEASLRPFLSEVQCDG